MKREDILHGLQGYEKEMNVVIRVLRRGSFNQDDFDRAMNFKNCRKANSRSRARTIRRRRFVAYFPHQIIIGGLKDCRWEFMLDLIQHMVLAGLVNTHKNADGKVVYTLGAFAREAA